jgi:general secretion pathway protein K
MKPRRTPSPQRGAALLLALVILTLVGTVAAGMVWQQSRAIHVEAAERARAQSTWVFAAGVEGFRELIAGPNRERVEDKRPRVYEAKPIEFDLSAFLSFDQVNNADHLVKAKIAGVKQDAQARYNLRNLVGADGKLAPAELRVLQRLAQTAGVSGIADTLAETLRQAWAVPGAEAAAERPLAPNRMAHLAWLGVDAATIARLAEYADILPEPTPLDVNAAPAEVLAAVIEGLDLATAARIVSERAGRGFKTIDELRQRLALPERIETEPQRLAVGSNYFYVTGWLKFEDTVVQERALLARQGTGRGAQLGVLWRERRLATDGRSPQRQ